MKRVSFKYLLPIVVCISVAAGCIDQNIKSDTATPIQIENKAKFYQKVGETDSAIKYYSESVELFKNLQAQRTDTSYCRRIAYIYLTIGHIEDSLGYPDTSIYYYTQTMNWGDKGRIKAFKIEGELLIGASYYEMGGKNTGNPQEHKRLVEKGLKYTLAASWTMDSLGWETYDPKTVLATYYAIKVESFDIGDTVRGHFYETKFKNLFVRMSGHLPKEYQ